MQVDIAQLIADLLYEYDAVTIPKFGGLTSAYRSAAIDQVAGKLQPPTKELSFNENIVVNDGLLLGQLQKRFDLGQQEAGKQLDKFVSELKSRVDRGEKVSFPNIGQFYMAGNQSIQFTPDTTNFNTDAYGLPEVKFYPVTKGGVKPAFEKVATPPPPVVKEVVVQDENNWMSWLLPILFILALFVVAYSNWDYLFAPGVESADSDNPEAAIRINESPNREENKNIDEGDIVIEGKDSRNEEEVQIHPGQREAIVVVGLYSQSQNTRKAVERIYKMGYEAITDEKDGAFRVAARFGYSDEDELKRVHARLKRSFDKHAWIMKK